MTEHFYIKASTRRQAIRYLRQDIGVYGRVVSVTNIGPSAGEYMWQVEVRVTE